MFFQISPVHRDQKPKRVIKEKSPEKIETLSLGPFAATPKLFFDGIKIGETASCKLLLRNPTKQDITLLLTRRLPEELNVAYNWENNYIRSNSEVLFEITWTPTSTEASYHKITFENPTKTVHRDVPVSFKTSSSLKKTKPDKKTKPATINRKSPTKKYYVAKPPYISPKRYSLSPKKKCTFKKSPSPKKYYKQYLSPPNKNYHNGIDLTDYSLEGKENIPTERFTSSKNVSFKMEVESTTERRGTYILKREEPDIFNDSLETSNSTTLVLTDELKRPPLTSYNGSPLTPDISLGTYFKQKSEIPDISRHGFEYKLMRLESFCFTPTASPCKQKDKLTLRNENERVNIPRELNVSSETYTKSPLNSGTYVEDNTSFETYVKSNLSGETYTKDLSNDCIDNISPLRIKLSPSYQKRSTPKYPSCTPPLSAYLQDFSKVDGTFDFNSLHSENGNQDSLNSRFVFAKPQNDELPKNIFNNAKPSDFINSTPVIVRNPNQNVRNNSFASSRSYLSSVEEESIYTEQVSRGIRKKSDLDLTVNFAKPGGGFTGPKEWSKKGGTAFRVGKSSVGLNLKRCINTVNEETQEEVVSKLAKRDTNTVIIQNPFLLAVTDEFDPFMTSQLYVDEKWIDQQEIYFKKWLNSLLTPPQELYSEDKVIDVAKVWQECKKREVELPPTKEIISSKYHVNSKLNSLRKSAQNLFRSKEVSDVLSKVLLAVDSGKLNIRQDKDVHLNLSIKSQIMSLLLSYNALWLRIGLETIYNETIQLHSNSDIVGLSTFLINKLFKNPYLLKKYKSVHSPKYVVDFNKFFLKKFLTLVYFLDVAKNKKLIPHNPCLFCKKGAVKESKELLLILARELLSAVGDITKFLKFSGYIVSHVQTFIHEFDYAVKNLGVDLRDGIRLTKVMEIILLKEDLTNSLRVPAISLLQKVHNMKLVFDSLEKAGFKIMYDISPKDIVVGHREKTLSFLWQIIYKFEAPLMVKSVTTVQVWFRSLPVMLKRRKLQRVYLQKQNAARKIQNWYKRQKLAYKLNQFLLVLKRYLDIVKMEKAAVKIQAFYKMYKLRHVYYKKIKAVKAVQTYSRGWLIRNFYKERIKSAVVIQSYIRMFLARRKYLKVQKSVQTIQTWYRSKKQMHAEVQNYKKLKSTTLFIQQKWRANFLANKQRKEYEKLKQTVEITQRRFRTNILCKTERRRYLILKSATICIQNRYRSLKLMKLQRQQYITLKKTVLIVEERFLALKIMKVEKKQFNDRKNACLKIQKYYRSYKLMKEESSKYLVLKNACVTVQRRFRATKLMQKELAYYNSLKKTTIFIQQKFRANLLKKIERKRFLSQKEAAIKIQIWYKSTLEMRLCVKYYLSLCNSVKVVQDRYRAMILMRKEVQIYQSIRTATIVFQRRYKALTAMRDCKNYYKELKSSTVFVQRRFRANKKAELQRKNYLELKTAAMTIQSRYRAKQEMLKCKKEFETLKTVTINIQRRFRAEKLMKIAREEYLQLYKSTVVVQRLFRAKRLMLKEKKYYKELKQVVGNIQAKWRSKKLGLEQRKRFENVKKASIVIQRWWRSIKVAREDCKRFELLRKMSIFIQRKWRAKMLCRKFKNEYLSLKAAVLTIQKRWRAKQLGKIEKQKFEQIKSATIVIQRKLRATLLAKSDRINFISKKNAVLLLQAKWRAYKLFKKEKEEYQKLRRTTILIQQLWRANLASKLQRTYYLKLTESTLFIQEKWRAKINCRIQRDAFIKLKKNVVFIQQKWRDKIESSKIRNRYEKLRAASIFIQKRWRSKLLARRDRKVFLDLKQATIFTQRRWKCLQLGKQQRDNYKQLLKATVFIQQRWKSNKLTKVAVQRYVSLKTCTVIIQRRFRATLEMRKQKQTYAVAKYSIIIIQRWYRNWLLTRQVKQEYLLKKKAVEKIQKYMRGYLIRKKYADYFTPEAREKRKLEKLQNDAATKIQSSWRGYKSRCLESPKMKQIRERYKKANANAGQETTLQFKCKIALQTIAHENSTLFHINNALEDIDYATRRCKNICITLGKLIPEQLYLLLSSTNRSLPEMNVCISSVNILINFFKLKETKESSFCPNYLEKLVTLMMHWCDKESQLFPALCTLFWLFAHTPQWKRLILNLPNMNQKLEKIKVLVTRKENMVKRQGGKGSVMFASFKNLPTPSLVTDWGLDYKNNPFAFTNSVHALNSLMSILYK